MLARFAGASFVALVTVISLTAGCAPDVPETLDDAGPIVPHSGLPAWQISADPLVSVGGADAPSEEHLVLATSAFLKDDGGLVIVDEGTREVVLVDADGSVVRRVGGHGDGPSEYRSATWIPDWSSDSILIFDADAQRLSFLDPEGDFVRSMPITADSEEGFSRATVIARVASGQILMKEEVLQPPGWAGTGYRRLPATLGMYSADGERAAWARTVQGDAALFGEWRGNPVFGRFPFFPALLVAATPARIFVFEGPEYVLESFGTAGLRSARVRVDHPTDTLSRESHSEWLEWRLQAVPADALAETRRYLESTYEPWPLPAVRRLVTDELGRLWVGEWTGGGPVMQWTVFDSMLEPLARVTAPEGFRLLSVNGDLVVGMLLDELEVQRIEVRRLSFPG